MAMAPSDPKLAPKSTSKTSSKTPTPPPVPPAPAPTGAQGIDPSTGKTYGSEETGLLGQLNKMTQGQYGAQESYLGDIFPLQNQELGIKQNTLAQDLTFALEQLSLKEQGFDVKEGFTESNIVNQLAELARQNGINVMKEKSSYAASGIGVGSGEQQWDLGNLEASYGYQKGQLQRALQEDKQLAALTRQGFGLSSKMLKFKEQQAMDMVKLQEQMLKAKQAYTLSSLKTRAQEADLRYKIAVLKGESSGTAQKQATTAAKQWITERENQLENAGYTPQQAQAMAFQEATGLFPGIDPTELQKPAGGSSSKGVVIGGEVISNERGSGYTLDTNDSTAVDDYLVVTNSFQTFQSQGGTTLSQWVSYQRQLYQQQAPTNLPAGETKAQWADAEVAANADVISLVWYEQGSGASYDTSGNSGDFGGGANVTTGLDF